MQVVIPDTLQRATDLHREIGRASDGTASYRYYCQWCTTRDGADQLGQADFDGQMQRWLQGWVGGGRCHDADRYGETS